MIAQVWAPPDVVAFTQPLVPDAVAPRSSSAPTTTSSRARVPAVFPRGRTGKDTPRGKTPPGTTPEERPSLDASVAFFLALPCRAEESLRCISAGCFAVREGEEIARASDRTCGDGEVASAQWAQPSAFWYRFFGCGVPLCRIRIEKA